MGRFCPAHERAAAELIRVCRSGGSIGLIAWTPEGLIGSLFGVLAPYAPPPPAGARAGSLWGTEQYVSELLGDAVDELCSERRSILFDGIAPDAFVNLMRTSYGPVLRVFERLQDDRARADELDAALRRFARARNPQPGRSGRSAAGIGVQLTFARRRGD